MSGLRARPTELRLLLWPVALAATGSVAVALADAGGATTLTGPTIVVPVAVAAAGLTLHVALRILGSRSDQVLVPLTLTLVAIGLVLVQRLAPGLLPFQIAWLAVGLCAFIATLALPRDLGALSRYPYSWALAGLVLLLSPLLPVIGREINGARIWVRLGIGSFQPSEAAKIALVIFFAAYLAEHRELIARARAGRFGPFPRPPLAYLAPILVMWIVAMLVLVAERDLGATLLVFGAFLALLYLATGELAYVAGGLLLLSVGGAAAVALFPHVAARIDIWQRPFADDLRFGASYQVVQGLFALAGGGLFGAGLGGGLPERIPVVWSDFVFDAFAEETGFAGVLALLSAYLLLAYRGLAIAFRAPTAFLQLLAGGLAASLAIQTLVVVAGNAALVPLTGMTLPFVAYGGSSLLANFVLLALLLRVSHASAASTATARGQPIA